MTLKEYIKSKDMTNRAFADLADIEASLITRWVIGEVRPSQLNYEKIYEATGGQVTPNDFFDLESVSP